MVAIANIRWGGPPPVGLPQHQPPVHHAAVLNKTACDVEYPLGREVRCQDVILEMEEYYRDFELLFLDDVSFLGNTAIDPSVGWRNGAGKFSLMKILTEKYSVTAWEIWMHGNGLNKSIPENGLLVDHLSGI